MRDRDSIVATADKVERDMTETKVRVVENGDQVSRIVPISEAEVEAEDRGLSLVQVAEATGDQVAVVRLVDQGYEDYLARKSHKKPDRVTVKYVEFGPSIEQSDYDRKMRQVSKFLGRGFRVQARLPLHTRRRTTSEIHHRIGEFLEGLPDGVQAEYPTGISPGVRMVTVGLFAA